MRDANVLLYDLEKNHKQVFDFVKQKAQEKDEEGNYIYFVGLRNKFIDIYYRCRRLLEIKEKDSKVFVSTDKEFIRDTGLEKSFSFDELTEETLDIIKENIEKFVSSNSKREFVCQQYIANMYNSHLESDWFVIDMEYNQEGTRSFGRQDLIAIRRTPKDKKYEVAIIELKVGDAAYGGITHKMVNEKYKDQYKLINNGLYATLDGMQTTNISAPENVKFGSGIVSHIVGFMRYLYDEDNYNGMKYELVQMLKAYRMLGLNVPLVDSINDFSVNPTIYIVSYTHVPGWETEKEEKKKQELCDSRSGLSAIQRLKFKFGRYLYDTDYCLVEMLNSSEISAFSYNGAKSDYKSFVESDSSIKEYKQRIGKRDISFKISFVDPDEKVAAWECL